MNTFKEGPQGNNIFEKILEMELNLVFNAINFG